MNKNHLPIMTIAEVAEYLPKVSRASVYKLAQRGKIPCQKVGRHWRFHRQAIDEMLRSPKPLAEHAPDTEASLQDIARDRAG